MMFKACLGVVVCGARLSVAVNKSASPLPVVYSREASIGPDGPWWFVTAAIGPQAQQVNLMPGFSATTLVIDTLACSSPDARCPESSNGSFQTFNAEQASSNPDGRSQEIQAESWGAQQANILDLGGVGQYYAESMALQSGDARNISLTTGEHAIVVSNNYTVQYPGGTFYTMSTGFLSLYAGASNVSWTATDGNSMTRYRTLPAAYQDGQIPSMSSGVHVGSVDFNVSGSLTFGGYDRSRCIADPIISDDIFVTLVKVSLGIAAGNSSFIDLPQGATTNLLQANGSVVSELSIRPNPGMPYIYLPRETCDAIASHLPVTYSRDLNIYFWNVSDPVYERIVRSPHYLSFSFASGSGLTRSIDVPFALLNLTMDGPLMSTPTPYFPCSPWLPSAAPYNFGRSFLQAAFLAQNWQAGKLYLGQAPGPDHAAPDVQPIADTDATLTSLADAPTWFSTWSATYEALAQSSNDSPNPLKSGESSGGVSKGTIAGAVIGALAGVALILDCLLWLIRRHKKARAAVARQETASMAMEPLPQYSDDGRADQKVESGAEAIHEVAADPRPPAELDANGDTAKMIRKHEPMELAAEGMHPGS